MVFSCGLHQPHGATQDGEGLASCARALQRVQREGQACSGVLGVLERACLSGGVQVVWALQRMRLKINMDADLASATGTMCWDPEWS